MSVDEIKKKIKSDELILGIEETLKALRSNELVKIFIASNAPEKIVKDVEYYAGIVEVEVEKLDIPNDELGVICKKPFSILCIGMTKTVQKRKY